MKIIIYIIISLIITIYYSCEKKIEWEYLSKPDDVIVVDGMITNERKSHYVKLSKPIVKPNDEKIPISGAIVSIYDGESSFFLKETPVNSGIYLTDSNMIGVISKEYVLNIIYKNKGYSAKASMVPVTPFKPLKYIWNKRDSAYYLYITTTQYSAEEPAMWEIFFDLSYAPGYTSLPSTETHARLIYYTLPTIDVSQLFAPVKESIPFPKGTKLIVRKYSLTNEHAEFIRSLLYETEWRGGYFDAAHASVTTNLSNGAVGFFSACTVIADTIIVN